MLSPGQIVLISAAAGAVALILLTWAARRWNDAHPTEWDIVAQGNYNVNAFTAEEVQDEWVAVYSPEANEGYTKRVERDGNFEFTVFECQSDYDGLHPDFLIYARYTGDAEVETMAWDGAFLFSDGDTFSGLGYGGDETEYYLVVGSASRPIDFRLTVSVFDETDWNGYFSDDGGELSDFVTDSGSVTISVHPHPESD